jgi:hypothetical protein
MNSIQPQQPGPFSHELQPLSVLACHSEGSEESPRFAFASMYAKASALAITGQIKEGALARKVYLHSSSALLPK